MKNPGILILAVLFFIPAAGSRVFAHCEIPCGIHDDEARLNAIAEDILTIEKGMKQILELAKDPSGNANQLVRWVQNKDEHAERIKETVADYFLSQRIQKPAEGSSAESRRVYDAQLEALHDLTVLAVKTKQTTDLKYVTELRATLHAFRALYRGDPKKTSAA